MEERKAERLKEMKRRERGRELTEREASGHADRQTEETCVFDMIEWKEGEQEGAEDGGI